MFEKMCQALDNLALKCVVFNAVKHIPDKNAAIGREISVLEKIAENYGASVNQIRQAEQCKKYGLRAYYDYRTFLAEQQDVAEQYTAQESTKENTSASSLNPMVETIDNTLLTSDSEQKLCSVQIFIKPDAFKRIQETAEMKSATVNDIIEKLLEDYIINNSSLENHYPLLEDSLFKSYS